MLTLHLLKLWCPLKPRALVVNKLFPGDSEGAHESRAERLPVCMVPQHK